MSEPDLLFTVRNSFYLGAFQGAIAEASDLEGLSEAAKTERDTFVYRSWIELGSYELVIKEVDRSSPQALQAVKLLAQYLGKKLDKEQALATVADWLADPTCASNATTAVVAGTIYISEEDYVAALKACHHGSSLEMMALCVQIYLKMDRVDQAEKQLNAMSSKDDDAILTQLATAWVDLYLGGAKVSEALVIFQELQEKYSGTVRILNGTALCQMRQNQWQDAESTLQEAYEKDPKHPETLANLITVCLHLSKNTARYTSQLTTQAPQHPSVRQAELAAEAFQRAADSFVAS
ncbi:hypothetical protein WJX73_006844 [Symbiochloris irregularis]|uniref:Coatomer subunit epsilon n=1 Tax=Symbiochloris irregularis TaxID=706552 RepID=A0AAW1PQX0_9CHLO